jgi:hypothetical protein
VHVIIDSYLTYVETLSGLGIGIGKEHKSKLANSKVRNYYFRSMMVESVVNGMSFPVHP